MKRVVISTRIREVLLAVATAKSNKVIAFDLGITEATVKLHVKSLMRTFQVSNRTELAIAVYGLGLLQLPSPSVELCEKRLVPLTSHADMEASA